MENQSCPSAPCEDSAQGGKLRHASMFTTTGAVHEPSNLQKMNDDDVVFCNITYSLAVYTQRNVSFEVQKALEINIMATAISKWNCGVMEAADCCGFNAETVRLWASAL